MSDDSLDEDDRSSTNSHTDDTIRELAARLDTIIESDERVWIDPNGEYLQWTPSSGNDTGEFVCGLTGTGKTTRWVNCWQQTVEEPPTWSDPNGVDDNSGGAD